MEHQLLKLAPVIALLAWAAVMDVRTRTIKNWLTFGIAVGGVAVSICFGGTRAIPLSSSLLGLLVGSALPLLPFVVGAMGGGDVKLLAGIGAWIGPWPVFAVFIVAALVGLFIVLIQCAMTGKLKTLFRNSALLVVNAVHVREVGIDHATETGRTTRSVDKPLPYAVPVLVAVLIVLSRMG